MVGIIGGGIAGLTAAFQLAERGIDVQVFEASDRAGGKIHSERVKGFLVEHGPNSLQRATPLMHRIIDACGLSGDLCVADEKARNRFIVRQDMLEPLPMTPPALLKSSFFSLQGKLRIARDLFLGRGATDAEESVAQFVRRRLGSEVLDYAVDPFVTGIFAGNPEALSLRHAFPSLFNIEQDHGSLIRGLVHRRKKRTTEGEATAMNGHTGTDTPGIRSGIFTFREGMQQLVDGLTRSLGDRIHTGHRIRSIEPCGERWCIDAEEDGRYFRRHLDAVISTIPLPNLQALHIALPFDLAPLWDVQYPPVTVLAMGFKAEHVPHPLDGFGMLVPRTESNYRILGTIFSSSVFPSHAPDGHVLLTTMIGGTRNANLTKLTPDILQDLVLKDLYELLGVYTDPIMVHQVDWPFAIPQYNIGYGAVKDLLNDIEKKHPGLVFAGNYREGISVADAMQSGHHAAERIMNGF